MKEKIVLLNVMRYSNDKGSGCRLGFIFADSDKICDSDKFLGYSELSMFYDESIFDKFTKDMIGQPLDATFKVKTNPTNPLKTTSIIEKITYKGNDINLL